VEVDGGVQLEKGRLRDRRLPKSVDLRHKLVSAIKLDQATNSEEKAELKKRLERLITSIEKKLSAWSVEHPTDGIPLVLTDRDTRDPYKRFQESKGPLNQIHIRLNDNQIYDVAACSSVIAAIESFEFFRAYVDDDEARRAVEEIVQAELGKTKMDRAESNWETAAELVRDAGGRIVGRTKLQKVAYLLELAGFGAGFRFEYRHYGPYSEELADAITIAAAFGLIEEDERQTDWGGMYSIYSSTAKVGQRASGPRALFAEAAVQIGAVELELAATAAYLKSVERSAHPWDETKKLKPEKATPQRLQAAKKAYENLRKLQVPKALPNI
jgi:uncharacterized protein